MALTPLALTRPTAPRELATRFPCVIDETDGAAAIAELVKAAQAHPIDSLLAFSRVERRQRDNLPVGVVVALCGGFAIRVSADAGRRAAALMSQNNRAGAALDLWRVCDEAEEQAAWALEGSGRA